MLGVLAVSVDATALACEVACAIPQLGEAAPHERGASLGQHGEHGEHMMHETSASPEAHGEALHQGAMQQCVTVNEVSLQAGAGRIGVGPLVLFAATPQVELLPSLVIPSEATVAGSPPARNGPSQNSSVLRI